MITEQEIYEVAVYFIKEIDQNLDSKVFNMTPSEYIDELCENSEGADLVCSVCVGWFMKEGRSAEEIKDMCEYFDRKVAANS